VEIEIVNLVGVLVLATPNQQTAILTGHITRFNFGRLQSYLWNVNS